MSEALILKEAKAHLEKRFGAILEITLAGEIKLKRTVTHIFEFRTEKQTYKYSRITSRK